LAGYTGNTRLSYTTDLRLFADWCADNRLRLLEVRRAHLEMFARTMEQQGRMRSTVARRSSTRCSFYRYCHLEGLLARDPAAHVRRPKVDPESRTLGVDRNELGALLVQAGLGSRRAHALISLLAMNGLPISEALGANIDDLDVDRGHRTLRVVPKGGKQAAIPPAPRTARALDLSVGERATGPIFLGAAGARMDRYAADRTVKRMRASGRDHQADLAAQPAPFLHTAALDAGVPLRDVQEAASYADPRTTMRYDRARQSLDRHATYIVAALVRRRPLTSTPRPGGTKHRYRASCSPRFVTGRERPVVAVRGQ
jgi:site-specific recombinase XerD